MEVDNVLDPWNYYLPGGYRDSSNVFSWSLSPEDAHES
jgi:hypothetical protein